MTSITTACSCIHKRNTRMILIQKDKGTYTYLEKWERKKLQAIFTKYWEMCAKRSFHRPAVVVFLFWTPEYFPYDKKPRFTSCTEHCEWLCQLQYTLFIMMRHCEYSSFSCILFAKGVTSPKAEWMQNYRRYVQQMRLEHSSCFVVIQVFTTFVLHSRVTLTKQN